MMKKWDKVLFAALLLLSLLGIAETGRSLVRGGEAVVTIDEQEVRRLPLDGSGLRTFTDCGLTYTLEIGEDRVRMVEIDCPNRICIHTGWTAAGGTPVVCLPNRLILEVEAP